MPCTDTENTPLPGDTENVLLRKLLNRLCNVTSGGGGGVSQAYVDARDAATLLSANNNAVAGDAATLAAAMSSASALYVLKAGDTMTGALLLPNGAVSAPSLSHVADSDTGLWYPAADTIAFSTVGVERFRITDAGVVGIGTTSPNPFYKLHVSGAGVIVAATSTGANEQSAFRLTGRAASIDNTWTFSNRGGLDAPNNRFGFFNDTAMEVLTLLSSGNVGIGVTAPLAKLHVTPAASGTDYFRIDHSDGTPRLQVGALTGALTNGAIWFGNITPDATNYGLVNDGGTTFLNADTGGAINFSIAGASVFNMSSAGNLLWTPDNTYNIGAAGANRPANYFGAGTVNAASGLITGNVASLVTSSAAMNDGAAAALGTLTNAPAAGNPTKWIPIDDNGTTRYIPTW